MQRGKGAAPNIAKSKTQYYPDGGYRPCCGVMMKLDEINVVNPCRRVAGRQDG